MTDDVLAERSLCNLSTCYIQATLGTKAINAAPVGRNVHFQGHLHCHPPFEELLNQPVIKGGWAAERQQAKRGEEDTTITLPWSLQDPYRIKGRASNSKPYNCVFERRRLSSLPLLLPPSIFCSLTSFSLWSQLCTSSLQTPLVKYRWWPHYHYMESAAPWKKNNLPRRRSGQ